MSTFKPEFNMQDLYPGKDFDKVFDELSERTNAHQLAMEELWGDSSDKLFSDLSKQDVKDREAFLSAQHGTIELGKAAQQAAISFEGFAEAAAMFGEAQEDKGLRVIVVTGNEDPKLLELLKASDYDVHVSETMPASDTVVLMGGRGGGKNALTAEHLKSILDIKPHVFHNAKRGGRTSKGERIRKRQQWRK